MTIYPDNLKKYGWKCPYPGCIYEAIMYGEASLKVAKELHLTAHDKNDQISREEFKIAQAEFQKFMLPPVKDYNVLELTVADKAFLKTRGIKT